MIDVKNRLRQFTCFPISTERLESGCTVSISVTWCQSIATTLPDTTGFVESCLFWVKKQHFTPWRNDTSIHLGYADPSDDEPPWTDFDFAEPFEDDATVSLTKSDPCENEAAVDFGVDDPFEDDAAWTFGADFKSGFALVIVTEDDFAGGPEDSTRDWPAADDDSATPLALGIKRVASEVDWERGLDG